MIYVNDMKIMENDSGVDCWNIAYTIVSIFLLLAFYGAIPLALLVNRYDVKEEYFAIMAVYIPYQLISCFNAATKYIRNLTTLQQTFLNIEAAILAAPIIHLEI